LALANEWGVWVEALSATLKETPAQRGAAVLTLVIELSVTEWKKTPATQLVGAGLSLRVKRGQKVSSGSGTRLAMA